MRILVLFGGESVEHEISVITASQIMSALSVKYTVIPVYISKENKLYHVDKFKNIDTFKEIDKYLKKKNEIQIKKENKRSYLKLRGLKKKKYFDFAFCVVHGKGMEDSTLLSYLKFKKIPVISDSVSFYALAQNKVLTKRVLNDLGINNVEFEEIKENEDIDKLDKLGFPLIIKPNNLGSSIGVNKANDKEELEEALKEAFNYDKKVLVEKFVLDTQEYNISVMNRNGEILVSNIEQVVKGSEVLTYKQKYESGAKGMASSKRICPVELEDNLKQEIEDTAKKIYEYFEAKGVIRIDFLYSDKLYVNEINSIPGSYAYYLWKGKMDFTQLLDCVIEEGKRDFYKQNKLVKSINKMNIFAKYKGSKGKV